MGVVTSAERWSSRWDRMGSFLWSFSLGLMDGWFENDMDVLWVSVCKSCLVRRLENIPSCPTCGIQLQRSRLAEQLRLDHAIQLLVYTAVPGLWTEEQRRRQFFIDHHPLSKLLPLAFPSCLLSVSASSHPSFGLPLCLGKGGGFLFFLLFIPVSFLFLSFAFLIWNSDSLALSLSLSFPPLSGFIQLMMCVWVFSLSASFLFFPFSVVFLCRFFVWLVQFRFLRLFLPQAIFRVVTWLTPLITSHDLRLPKSWFQKIHFQTFSTWKWVREREWERMRERERSSLKWKHKSKKREIGAAGWLWQIGNNARFRYAVSISTARWHRTATKNRHLPPMGQRANVFTLDVVAVVTWWRQTISLIIIWEKFIFSFIKEKKKKETKTIFFFFQFLLTSCCCCCCCCCCWWCSDVSGATVAASQLLCADGRHLAVAGCNRWPRWEGWERRHHHHSGGTSFFPLSSCCDHPSLPEAAQSQIWAGTQLLGNSAWLIRSCCRVSSKWKPIENLGGDVLCRREAEFRLAAHGCGL